MNNLNKVYWGQWETLLAVFRTGTYTQAAKLLRLDATTVGRRIKLLEKRLGGQLLFRQDGRLYPTDQCERLLCHIETASEALRSAELESSTVDSGAIWRSLRLTAPPFMINNLLAPSVKRLVENHRIRIELLGTANNLSLSRREADIAIRIDDKPPEFKTETDQIESEQIGLLNYSIYCAVEMNPKALPWAGLMEENVRTSGSQKMIEIAAPEGFQFRAYHFDALVEMTASGISKAMLPSLLADSDSRLKRIGKPILQQPLWMLWHRQDQDVPHLKTTRSWIKELASKKM